MHSSKNSESLQRSERDERSLTLEIFALRGQRHARRGANSPPECSAAQMLTGRRRLTVGS